MTKKRRSVVAVVMLLACVVGFLSAWILDDPLSLHEAELAALSGRHLEPPWWESIQHSAPVPEVPSAPTPPQTYTVPSDVLFATGSSAVDGQGQAALRGLLPQLQGAKTITVAGCTDAVAGIDSPYNLQLSQGRANGTVSYLESLGLSPSLFHTLAWADTHPVVTRPGLDIETVNALNRRIVIIVTK